MGKRGCFRPSVIPASRVITDRLLLQQSLFPGSVTFSKVITEKCCNFYSNIVFEFYSLIFGEIQN